MRLRGNWRIPWIDLWIVPTVVLIGWATFHLAKLEPQITKNDQNLLEIQDAFTQRQKVVRESVYDLERKRRESDQLWQETMLLKGEFVRLAERLGSDVPGLEKALDESVSHKGSAESQRRIQELQAWMAREKDRVSTERLDSKSIELQQRLEGTQLSGANGPLQITEDLGRLIAAIDETYQQYILDLNSIRENFGKPLVGSFVATRTASGHQAVRRLTELAQEARKDAQAIQAALETEPRSETSERSRRQQEILRSFVAASSPSEFARRIKSWEGSTPAYGDSPTTSAVRRVRYGLLATLATLAAFLIVDVYRRAVVSPLRLKLVEHEGQIEHQKKLAHFEELAAGLAHEIRNPLTAISARLYTIQRKLREGTPEHEDTLVIGSQIERANQILKEFIQVTRPAPPRLELMTAGPLLEDVSHLMSPQLERKEVKLEVQLPARTRFYGDQQQLKQVLVNLVQNAAESMDRGGEVILRAREEKVPFKGALTCAAIIEVEDNGPGIRPEVQDRLFEPFFSTKKEGTGLGLPISARIIDRHGGTLDFKTQPKRGTIFRIVLPSYEEQ
jgi:signal transduction histidine kinase